MENKKLLQISIIILAVCNIFVSIWIGNSLEKAASLQASTSKSRDKNTNDINSQASWERYLGYFYDFSCNNYNSTTSYV